MRRVLIVLVILALAVPAFGRHAWSRYHWASQSFPMNIKVGDNVSSAWDAYLTEAIGDWNQSSKLNLSKVTGSTNSNCDPVAGRIEVCNGAYGQNGWLGIAQIWLNGGGRNHIGQAVAKMNDTYYASATYNTPGWRDLVMCQEVGHDFGLGHQDERNTNTNLGSCMDYTNYPDGGGTGGALSNRAPNAHDYAQLEDIYNHTDSNTSWFATTGSTIAEQSIGGHMPVIGERLDHPWQWGTAVEWDESGRAITYQRTIRMDVGNHHFEDVDVVTEVFWAPLEMLTPPGDAREAVRDEP